MEQGLQIGELWGFAIRIHWSVVVLIWLFAWSLASSLPASVPGHSQPAYWLAGLGGATALGLSLLLHELSHAVVARRAGVRVVDLTLWLFGGVARLSDEAESPRSEFRIAAAGPATSIALAAAFGCAAVGLRAVNVPELVVAVVAWLAVLNAALAAFNLLPGSPLDGGRILRAYLWHRYGDPDRAALDSARTGTVLAYSLIGLGLLQFLLGALIGGTWLAFLGWFLLTAARAEHSAVRSRRILSKVSVAEAMTPQPRTAPASISVDAFVRDYVLGARHSAYPVVAEDGSLVGLITLAQVRSLPAARRAHTSIGDVAIPPAELAVAESTEPVTAVLERMTASAGGRVLVIDSGHLVGILTAADVSRLIDVATPADSTGV
ncbi:zinc metalloprotease [Mycobacterium sp. djl-10]|nr:zinc metalloprotease [Mycobacterium sp. djl-10]